MAQYEKSELRTIEILENLCKYSKDFKLDKQQNRYVRFRESSTTDATATGADEEKFNPLKKASKLKTLCDNMVETHEDELTTIIKSTLAPAPAIDVLKNQFCIARKSKFSSLSLSLSSSTR